MSSPLPSPAAPGAPHRCWGRLVSALPLRRVKSSSVPRHSRALRVLPQGLRACGAWWHKAGGIASVSPRDRSLVHGQGWAGWDLWPLPCFGRGRLPSDCSGSRPEEGDRVVCGGQGDLGGPGGCGAIPAQGTSLLVPSRELAYPESQTGLDPPSPFRHTLSLLGAKPARKDPSPSRPLRLALSPMTPRIQHHCTALAGAAISPNFSHSCVSQTVPGTQH